MDAINLDDLRIDIYGSADPVDVCFRKCFADIASWSEELLNSRISAKLGNDESNYTLEKITPVIVDGIIGNLIVLIVDECDGKTKNTLQKSFRSLRPPHTASSQNALSYFHDDMYFGDSRYSIGIQLADLCSYFIARHLEGDKEIEDFYEMIEPRIYRKKEVVKQIKSEAAEEKAIEDREDPEAMS